MQTQNLGTRDIGLSDKQTPAGQTGQQHFLGHHSAPRLSVPSSIPALSSLQMIPQCAGIICNEETAYRGMWGTWLCCTLTWTCSLTLLRPKSLQWTTGKRKVVQTCPFTSMGWQLLTIIHISEDLTCFPHLVLAKD